MTKNLQKFLIDQNISITKIAAETGISRVWVSNLLNGRYKTITQDNALNKIAGYLGLSRQRLLKMIQSDKLINK